mgnify:CR=1 FL=1
MGEAKEKQKNFEKYVQDLKKKLSIHIQYRRRQSSHV